MSDGSKLIMSTKKRNYNDENSSSISKTISFKRATKRMKLDDQSSQKIDEEIRDNTERIKSMFEEFHQLLNQREICLIEKLNKIGNISKQEIDENIHDINDKITVKLDKASMVSMINSFGDISGDQITLLSIINNEDCTVGVRWKLNEEPINAAAKLKVEWNDDIYYDIKQKWKYNKEFIINNLNDSTVNIELENKNARYLFKIEYFNGECWSNSNIKTIKIKSVETITSKWVESNIGSQLSINDIDSIQHIGERDNYQSAFLSGVVYSGTHIWKFKVNNKINICNGGWNSSGWTVIGIYKIKNATNPYFLEQFFTSCSINGCYGYDIYFKRKSHGGGTATGGDYGVICKSGDIIEMILNFDSLCLSYTVNGVDCGKAYDVESTVYKAAVACYSKGESITLISYQRKQTEGNSNNQLTKNNKNDDEDIQQVEDDQDEDEDEDDVDMIQ